ncbi:MAG: BON domain-containing protein [Holosporales bacterium]|jgi:osmotically-inducible protein OsmY|nr:BON domain-containing protein [Holosporales bacterium]
MVERVSQRTALLKGDALCCNVLQASKSGETMWRVTIGCCVFLSGCVPATLVGTAAVGTSLRSDEGVSGVFSDADIRTRIYKSLRDKSKSLHDNITVTVKEGRVLLTGRLKDKDACQAAFFAVRAAGVAQIICNEIQVGAPLPSSIISHDIWITTQAESALLFDSAVHSLNYKLTTTDGILYILGTAHTQFERESVQNHLCRVEGVKRVISYIRLAPPSFKKDAKKHTSPSAQSSVESASSYPVAASLPEEETCSTAVRKL